MRCFAARDASIESRMRQWKAFIIVILITVVFRANFLEADQALDDTATQAQSTLNAVNQLDPSVQRAGVCPACQSNQPTLLECLRLVCPSGPKTVSDIEAEVKSAALKQIDGIKPAVSAKVDAWINGFVAKEQQKLLNMDTLLKTHDTAVPEQYYGIHNLTLLFGIQDKLVFRQDGGSLSVDREKSAQKLAFLSDEDRDWVLSASQSFNQETEIGILSSLLSRESVDVQREYQESYPNLSLSEAIKKDAEELQSLKNRIKTQVLGSAGSDVSMLDELLKVNQFEEVVSGRRRDPAALTDFYLDMLRAKAFADMLLKPDRYSWLYRRWPKDIAAAVDEKALRQNLEKAKAYLNDSRKVAALKKRITDTCVTELALHKAALPTVEDLKKNRQTEEKVKAAIKDKVLERFSTHSAEVLGQALNQFSLIYPQTAADFEQDFYEGLEDLAKGAVKSPGNVKAGERQHLLAGFYGYLDPDRNPDEYYKSKLDYCHDDLPEMNDAADLGRRRAWVSWQTLKDQKNGILAIAHEFGHLVEWEFKSQKLSAESTQKFKDVQACLMKKHPEETDISQASFVLGKEKDGSDSTLSFEQKKYNVEDFADMVAALAFPEQNLGCFVSNPRDPDANDLFSSVLQYDPSETHSSAAFLILHSQGIRKGKIPQICQTALETAGTPRDFSSCLK